MMTPSKKTYGLLAASFVSIFLLTSCGEFFVPNNGGGSGSSCSSCVYIANSGTDDIAQFAVTNPLTVVASTNVAVSDVPSSIAVSPAGPYVYVGTVNSGIFLFAIQSGGSLGTVQPGSSSVGPYAMTVSPDGEWLYTASLDVNGSCTTTGVGAGASGYPYQVAAFQIGSSGALGTPIVVNLPDACGSTLTPPTSLVVSADGGYLFMSAGLYGFAGLTFDESTTELTVRSGLSSVVTPGAISYNGVAVDPSSKYVFVATSGTGGSLTQYSINNTNGVYSLGTVSTQKPIDSLYAVTAPASGSYVYVTDRTSGKIYGYSYGKTSLAAISGSPFAPTTASNGTIAMVSDSASKYILTINTTTGPNLQQFSIGSTGALTATSTGTTSSGSWAPVALAVTGSGS
jgi:DNA-binding beta-propeller fold protein YncE